MILPTMKDSRMLMNQDKNKNKLLNMMHLLESMLTSLSNQVRKELKNLLSKAGSMNSLMLTRIQGTRALDRCHLAMTDKMDWTNPEGERFHNDMSKPLPLVVTLLEVYALSVTKIKAARYEQEGIEQLIPHLWSPNIYKYNRNAELVEKNYGYGYLKEIVVKIADHKEYTFDKIHNINGVDEFDLINALQLYIRRILIKKRVEDALGELHTKWIDNQKMLMRADELHKLSDGTLNKVYNKLDVMLRDNRLGFLNEGMTDREWTKKDKDRTRPILKKIEKTLRERRRFRRLEHFVGGRRNDTDYKLLVRHE
ncbi:hypothetical protein Tco_0767468 [Tanacetum coccineum]